MRTTLLAAVGVAALTISLTACGSSGTGSSTVGAKPAAGPASTAAAAGGVDCSDPDLGQAEWTAHCSSVGPQQAPSQQAAKVLKLGQTALTAGDPSPVEGPGGGVLEITPGSTIYLTKTYSDAPVNGRFVVVTMKIRSTTAVAAAQTAPISGGGWTYIAPDGQAITTMSGNASSVVPDGFNGGGAVEPGTYQWDSKAFDITPTQAGGTLLYKDGDGTAYRWQLPVKSTGPDVAKIQKSLR